MLSKPHGEGQYKFNSRHWANGNNQVKGVDFENSYSPTASASSVQTTFAFAAINCLILALLDVVNCFQSTLVPNSKGIDVQAPPPFMKWHKLRYPEHKVAQSESGKYTIQILVVCRVIGKLVVSGIIFYTSSWSSLDASNALMNPHSIIGSAERIFSSSILLLMTSYVHS